MTPLRYIILFGFSVLPALTQSPPQLRARPFYSLPDPGAWVEFRWTQTSSGGKLAEGTLRISSAGRKKVGDKQFRWVEIKLSSRAAGDRNSDLPRVHIRKLLVAERATGEALFGEGNIAECWDQEGNRPAKALPIDRVQKFLSMGMLPDAPLRLEARKSIHIKNLGACKTNVMTTESSQKKNKMEYRAWLTAEIPFGCACFEILERQASGALHVCFRAELTGLQR